MNDKRLMLIFELNFYDIMDYKALGEVEWENNHLTIKIINQMFHNKKNIKYYAQ